MPPVLQAAYSCFICYIQYSICLQWKGNSSISYSILAEVDISNLFLLPHSIPCSAYTKKQLLYTLRIPCVLISFSTLVIFFSFNMAQLLHHLTFESLRFFLKRHFVIPLSLEHIVHTYDSIYLKVVYLHFSPLK